MNKNEYTQPLSEKYAFKTQMFNYLMKNFESNASIESKMLKKLYFFNIVKTASYYAYTQPLCEVKLK